MRQGQAEQLQAILAEQPDPASLAEGGEGLPYMPPVIEAANLTSVVVAYVDMPGMSGITYLTAFGQDAYPFTSDRFQYVFQGLSTDGRWYVSAIFWLTTDLFPEKVTNKQAAGIRGELEGVWRVPHEEPRDAGRRRAGRVLAGAGQRGRARRVDRRRRPGVRARHGARVLARSQRLSGRLTPSLLAPDGVSAAAGIPRGSTGASDASGRG